MQRKWFMTQVSHKTFWLDIEHVFGIVCVKDFEFYGDNSTFDNFHKDTPIAL